MMQVGDNWNMGGRAKKLFLGNLSTVCNEMIIFKVFSKYGTVLQIQDAETGISMGFRFIKMGQKQMPCLD